MIVLGIDPGTANTGYGVVKSDRARPGRLLALDGGVIETPAGLPLERRLATIHARVAELVAEHAPAAPTRRRCSRWCSGCSRSQSCRSPITPPTRWRSRSAIRTARRSRRPRV